MVRSAAAVLAVLILPGFAFAQQAPGSYTVVDDDTLWDLAQRYYSNPFEWRVIWEANRTVVEDPNLIYPGEVLTIPGASSGPVTATRPEQPAPVEEVPPTGDQREQQTPVEEAGTAEAEARTIFYREKEPTASVVAMMDREYVAVDVDQVYSAPWLGPLAGEPRNTGAIRGFAFPTERGSTLRQFHQVDLRTDEPARVGDRLRSFRVTRSVADVGQVVTPTGLLTVTAVHDSGAVAVVAKEYGRVQPGDLVGQLPTFSLEVGRQARDVAGGPEAMIMGFAGGSQLKDIGHHAFLDLGANDGVGVGDEFVLFSDAVRSEVRGRLQVVSVTPTSATARIVSMSDDVFRQGVVVRLVRRMP
jgi:LysM repeat protein